MVQKYDIENILVHQKDRILTIIAQAEGVYTADEEIHEAGIMLEIVKELWHACDYGYKWKELKARIEDWYVWQSEQ